VKGNFNLRMRFFFAGAIPDQIAPQTLFLFLPVAFFLHERHHFLVGLRQNFMGIKRAPKN